MIDRPLTEQIFATIAAGQVQLPVHPITVTQAAALLQAGLPPSTRLVSLIGSDPVLACKLLHTANSAFYQGLPKVATIDEGLARIGVEHAAKIIDQVCRERGHAGRGPLLSRYLGPLWQHSVGCAIGARWLANRCGYRTLAEQAHLAGLIHDIGKWLLLAVFAQLAEGDTGIVIAGPLIDEVLNNLHVDVGLRLVAEQHLPDELAPVVGGHHQTVLGGQDPLVVLVRLANLGCRKAGLGWAHDPDLVLPTTAEAQFLGIDEIALAEYEIMLEDQFQLVPTMIGGQRQALQGEPS